MSSISSGCSRCLFFCRTILHFISSFSYNSFCITIDCCLSLSRFSNTTRRHWWTPRCLLLHLTESLLLLHLHLLWWLIKTLLLLRRLIKTMLLLLRLVKSILLLWRLIKSFLLLGLVKSLLLTRGLIKSLWSSFFSKFTCKIHYAASFILFMTSNCNTNYFKFII